MRIPAASRVVILLAGLAFVMGGGVAMGIEEAAYVVEKQDGVFEVRQYAPQVVAEISVDGTMEEAGNKAFRPLFNYISGANRAQGKIAMTAPVGQQAEGQKLAMTAPVGQEAVSNQWVVTFTMPTQFTLATLPAPTDGKVRLRAIPTRRMAAVCYSGTWSQKRYERNLARLRDWMKTSGLIAAGEPVWARYNPPFTPWFLRRNEILVPTEPAK
ncbi:MAG: heme-binding protein [bacterium]